VRNVNQATLNAYHDYAYDNGTNAPPTRYLRRSELSFVIGPAGGDIPEPETGQITLPGTLDTGQAIFFQGFLDYVQNTGAYGGMESLLNACGYFVDFGTLPSVPSHVSGSSNPYRYRLMQMLVPAEKLENYENPAKAWFVTNEAKGHILPVADNVIALIVRPLDPGASPADLGEHFTYDSRIDVAANPQPVTANQLPPVLQITMVSIDESSAKRIDNGATPPEAIAEALKERFRDVELFESDLEAVQDQLIANGISCQVFSSAVPLRESKWTK